VDRTSASDPTLILYMDINPDSDRSLIYHSPKSRPIPGHSLFSVLVNQNKSPVAGDSVLLS